MGLSTAAQAY
jgi:hypothetical protein